MPFRRLIEFWHTVKKVFQSELLPVFDLRHDVDEAGTVADITEACEFRGARVWTLIFAILIASIGLNVNSTAVIIGAMLISPLMGPIVAAGLALAINDGDLLKRAARNLLVATSISIGTATLYFLVSPLAQAQTELVARTAPTLYDVLIAFCGGATGIIASTRKERAIYAIAGVAIATALMPPLCTAGFGLANAQPAFFLGALYLFIINCFYILLATFLVVRFLNFRPHTYLSVALERKVGFYMSIVAVVVAVPSAYTGYLTVTDVIFKNKANRFLSENLKFAETKILERNIERTKDGNLIEVTTIGKALDPETIDAMRAKLGAYGLDGTSFVVHQTGAGSFKEMEARLGESIRSEMLTKFYGDSQTELKTQREKIEALESEVVKYRRNAALIAQIGPELMALTPKVAEVAMGKMSVWNAKTPVEGEPTTVSIQWKGRASPAERKKIEKFLSVRLQDSRLRFIHR